MKRHSMVAAKSRNVSTRTIDPPASDRVRAGLFLSLGFHPRGEALRR
ncbi:hypothetical protein [[Phormidium] sp. ETS-05]|nr:hypothetical protein [[Phormidium] sp. ETS-05]